METSRTMEPRDDEVIEETLPGPAAGISQADRDGYLLTNALSQRIDLIRHLIDFSRQVLLIVGDDGSGKTSMLHHLLGTAAENWRAAILKADPMCDADAVIRKLAEDFDLSFSDGLDLDTRIEAFATFLGTTHRAALVPIVFVDDAHLLPADALLLLLRLAQPDSELPNLRVVLFCDSRIARVLASPQLQAFKESLTHTVEIAPFTLEDTARYLATHWPASDSDAAPILKESIVREVHAASGGIPGRIRALIQTSSAEAAGRFDAGGPGMPSRQIARRIGLALAGGGIAMLIAVGIWRLLPSSVEPSQAPEPGRIIEEVALPADLPAVAARDMAPVGSPLTPPVQPSATTGAIQSAPHVTPPAVAVTPPGTSRESDAGATPPPQAAPAVESGIHPPPQPAPAPPVTAPTAGDSAQPTETGKAPAPAKPQPAKEKVVAKTSVPTDGGTWLRRQPAGNYVVQLYASYQRSSAEQFIRANKLGAKANIVATIRNNNTWYVVVLGSFSDRSRAKQAISQLPDPVRRLSPWVRKVGDLKAISADN